VWPSIDESHRDRARCGGAAPGRIGHRPGILRGDTADDARRLAVVDIRVAAGEIPSP